jgi:hypothetical protein
MLLRPAFSNGVCLYATAINYENDEPYEKWREARFKRDVIGKTVAQIVASEGPPDVNCGEYLMKEKRTVQRENRVSQVLIYLNGGTHKLLAIRNGRCILIHNSGFGTCTTGSNFWEHDDYEPVFRRP